MKYKHHHPDELTEEQRDRMWNEIEATLTFKEERAA